MSRSSSAASFPTTTRTCCSRPASRECSIRAARSRTSRTYHPRRDAERAARRARCAPPEGSRTNEQAARQPPLEPAAGEDRWQQDYAAQIGTDKPVRNRSGIAIKPLYTPRDWSGDAHDDDVGYPGQPPYTRGIYATMHRGRTWTQRQLIGLGTPPTTTPACPTLIAQGATAVSLIPCNSVYRGYDMDEVHAELLGTCGVVVNTVEHMDACLAGVDLALDVVRDERSVAVHAARVHAGHGEAPRRSLERDQRHVEPERLPEPLRRQPHVLPHRASGSAADPRRSHRLLQPALPKWNPMSVVGQHMQQAGATPAEAMALHVRHRAAERRRLRRARDGPRPVPAAVHVLLRHLAVVLRGDRAVPRRAPHLGAARRASATARRTRGAGASSSTRRPPASTSPGSSRSTTSRASPCRRWPASSAACNRCTPMPTTRRCPARPSSARASRSPRRTSCARKRT